VRVTREYDGLGPERFFSAHGFAPAIECSGQLGLAAEEKRQTAR
jgi:hypothetical protein